MSLEILSALAGAVFGAGGLAMLLRVLRKDVDGLGARVRSECDRNAQERFRTALLMVADEDDKEQRMWLVERFLSE